MIERENTSTKTWSAKKLEVQELEGLKKSSKAQARQGSAQAQAQRPKKRVPSSGYYY
jgi:hypothetical protein